MPLSLVFLAFGGYLPPHRHHLKRLNLLYASKELVLECLGQLCDLDVIVFLLAAIALITGTFSSFTLLNRATFRGSLSFWRCLTITSLWTTFFIQLVRSLRILTLSTLLYQPLILWLCYLHYFLVTVAIFYPVDK